MNQHNAAKFRSQTLTTTPLPEKNSDLKEVKEPPHPDPRFWGKKKRNQPQMNKFGAKLGMVVLL